MTISSWLNFDHPAPQGRGFAVGQKFLAPPCYSQHAVFASLWALFSFMLFSAAAVCNEFPSRTWHDYTNNNYGLSLFFLLSLSNRFSVHCVTGKRPYIFPISSVKLFQCLRFWIEFFLSYNLIKQHWTASPLLNYVSTLHCEITKQDFFLCHYISFVRVNKMTSALYAQWRR